MQTTRHERPRAPMRPDDGRPLAPMLFAVEDDPSTLDLLREVATDAGWSTRGFSRLSEFDRAMQEVVPDLVILDDELPDGRGGDRARELLLDRRLRGVPMLVFTAAHPKRRAEIGAWAPVIAKPFDLGEFERLLETMARRRMEVPEAAG